jgi:hypothetical protein
MLGLSEDDLLQVLAGMGIFWAFVIFAFVVAVIRSILNVRGR